MVGRRSCRRRPVPSVAVRDVRPCGLCGASFLSRSARSRFCGSYCLQRYQSARRNFGLSLAELRALLNAYPVCGGCGGVFGERGAQIDHCHESGAVRGVLCTRCNLAIGHAKDDPGRFFELSVYLERSRFDLRDLCLR